MKILIFGKGQLGQAYRDYFSEQPDTKAEIAKDVDIRSAKAVADAIERDKPDIVINAAAKTNLDWCETNPQDCFDVNTLGADTVALACQKAGVRLVHISTGC